MKTSDDKKDFYSMKNQHRQMIRFSFDLNHLLTIEIDTLYVLEARLTIDLGFSK
jgi:hypothetical protein